MSIQIVKRQGVSGQDCCCNCKSEIVDFTTLDANGAPRIIHERTKERKEDNLEKECKEEVCLIFGWSDSVRCVKQGEVSEANNEHSEEESVLRIEDSASEDEEVMHIDDNHNEEAQLDNCDNCEVDDDFMDSISLEENTDTETEQSDGSDGSSEYMEDSETDEAESDESVALVGLPLHRYHH